MEIIKYCNRGECEGAGVWSPVIQIWAKGYSIKDYPPIEIPFPLVVCQEHKEKTVIADLMDDDGFRRINGLVKAHGFKAADKESAKLSWVAVPQSPVLN